MRRTRSASLFHLLTISRSSSVLLTLLAAVVLLGSGCVAPGFDPERDILHEEKFVFEPKVGVFIPNEDEWDSGVTGGLKASYEVYRHFYLSFDFTYAGVDGNDDDFPGGFNTMTLAGGTTVPSDIRDLEGEALSEANRYAFIFSLDWDIPLTEGENSPLVRLGVGPGVLLVKSEIDASLEREFAVPAPANPNPPFEADADDLVMFVLRPHIGLRIPLGSEKVTLFGEAAYDWAMKGISIDLSGDNIHTDSVDFGGFSLFAGLSFKFW